jgi:hypothetical protein
VSIGAVGLDEVAPRLRRAVGAAADTDLRLDRVVLVEPARDAVGEEMPVVDVHRLVELALQGERDGKRTLQVRVEGRACPPEEVEGRADEVDAIDLCRLRELRRDAGLAGAEPVEAAPGPPAAR